MARQVVRNGKRGNWRQGLAMRRNTVAIIGSAGTIPCELRRTVETLACVLSDAGFDLVTGGMDGIMRAVARGHSRSVAGTNLVHIEPGWGCSWERNPHPAGIVRTDLGSMRNHLVIRSADLVVAVSGGSGTLSEIAIAWQEKKPIAALRGSGGWSDKLADTTLDRRGESTVMGCDTVDDILAWATRLRPEGVYSGRMNRDFYPLEVPALHRVHEGTPTKVHQVHLRYGMSIEKSNLVRRLEGLGRRVASWNREHNAETVALVTFDDGWKDVILLADTFEKLSCLCPVLLVGENHFAKPVQPLPLQRLYHHCVERGLDPEDRVTLGGVTRSSLKLLPEVQQHAALDGLGVEPKLDPEWLLNVEDIAYLKSAGWVVATHGHWHEDLGKRNGLGKELENLAEEVEARGHTPWLAWPEGQWSRTAWEEARTAGFHLQFGLLAQPCEASGEGMVMRTVWK